MKKILTSLALLGLGAGAYAQSVDLTAEALMIPNQQLTPGTPLTYTYYYNGGDLEPLNDSLPAYIGYLIDSAGGTLHMNSDSIQFLGPWTVLNEDGTMGFNVWGPSEEDISADEGYAPIVMIPNEFYETTDSINSLLDIDSFEVYFEPYGGIGIPFESIVLRRSELVNGQTYGWYTHVRPYPGWTEGPYIDEDPMNNWVYTPVIWQGNTSISDLLNNTQYTPLEVYPNPTVDKLSFELTFEKPNKSTVVRIMDINGRVLNTQRLGSAPVGTQQYSVDVSALPAGNYSIQVITTHAISVEKFVKK